MKNGIWMSVVGLIAVAGISVGVMNLGSPAIAQNMSDGVKQEAPKKMAAEPKGIYVQAGAFGNPVNANRLKDRLRAIGPTEVRNVLVNGATFYRVRLGPFAQVEDADLAMAQVVGLGEVNALIVIEK